MSVSVSDTSVATNSGSVAKSQRLLLFCLVGVVCLIGLGFAPAGMFSDQMKTLLYVGFGVITLVGVLIALNTIGNLSATADAAVGDSAPFEKTEDKEIVKADNDDNVGSFVPGFDAATSVQAAAPTAVPSSELALTDPLTKLGNKHRLIDKFNKMVDGANGAPQFAIGILDLDGMKPINDLFGYSGGDDVLKQCALRLSNSVDGDGFVMRYEGDEFAFIFPNVTKEEEIQERGKLLQEVLQAPFDLDGSTVRLSGSFGFGLLPHVGTEFSRVMENISSALYHSKRGGRGRLTVYSSEIEDLMLENARIEQALRRAIANNDVKPHYQPIISLQDGQLLGFEALARWIDKDLGFVSPAKFIPLAEERGIIAPLTEKLLLQAATTAASWPGNLFLSFNLSSAQLVDPTTADSILEVIKRAGLNPKQLEIEVTETAVMSDPEVAEQIIDQLHRAGIRISMDDFGTGQSSLGRLRELKLDKVKIDRAFIMAIGEDKPAEHIVRAILEMCAGLDLIVVAEGIEEIEQAESLKKYGCHAGQGYLFGKPQDEHKTMGYIREFIGDNYDTPEMQAAV